MRGLLKIGRFDVRSSRSEKIDICLAGIPTDGHLSGRASFLTGICLVGFCLMTFALTANPVAFSGGGL